VPNLAVINNTVTAILRFFHFQDAAILGDLTPKMGSDINKTQKGTSLR